MATPIIAFSKDWHEDPTSNHHVLRELAKHRRVLWLNSIGTRRPDLSSARDLGKIKRKLREFAAGAINVENDLWVATPLVLPLPHSPAATALNRQIMRRTIRALQRQLGIDAFQLWTFLPNTADHVGSLGEQLAVYYCVDEWATFPGLDPASTRRAEQRLLEKVACTFATSVALAEGKRHACPATYLAPHGVDHATFVRALDPDLPIPADLARIPGPRIGFFGTLRDFLDYDWIAGIARARPTWSIVLIGQRFSDVSALAALPNVHLLGQRPHGELPAYCKGFDVGLIPYRIDDDVKFINPLKLREYLSAGLPVVSTPMPEVLPFAHLCHLAPTVADAVTAIERALGETRGEARQLRADAMRDQTWTARAASVARIVDAAERDRTAARADRPALPTPPTSEDHPVKPSTPCRAGLVGAGTICEFHVAAVRALAPAVELIGLTDLDAARATTAAARFHTTAFADLDALVAAGANVIHVLTPPAAHARVARAALERGCHVIVEKPVTEDAEEARALGALARERGLTITVNHSLLFDPQVVRALAAVRAGELGEVVSVDILRGSEYPPYEGGPLPPWYREAGYPFRDIGVHGLYLLQALLGPIQDVDAAWCSLGGDPDLAYDEWRALVRCERGLGQLQITYNARPMQSQLIIHGTRGVLRVDLFAMFHGKRSALPVPRAAERIVNALTDSLQPLIDVPRGVLRFARKQVQPYQGLRDLIAEAYHCLATGAPPPVTIEDAATVVHWVEEVARAADTAHAAVRARFPVSEQVPFLVTGASGAVGRAIVQRLRAEGHRVRVFQRRLPTRRAEGVEYVFGNLGDPAAVDRAVRGADIVIHAGAAMKGGWPVHHGSTVVGTQNVIDACRRHAVRQLVHISSMSVIDGVASATRGAVDESAPLEPRADERGAYTRAKLEAERRVTAAVADGLPAVILRPGQIFGGGIPLITGAVARSAAGRWLVLGDGRLELPLVYLDDVVDAVLLAIGRRLTRGEVFHVIDPSVLTQAQVLAVAGGDRPIVRVPRAVVFALGALSELPLGLLGRASPIARYRLASALARLRYDSDRATTELGWTPRVGVREGIRRVSSAAAIATATATVVVPAVPPPTPAEEAVASRAVGSPAGAGSSQAFVAAPANR